MRIEASLILFVLTQTLSVGSVSLLGRYLCCCRITAFDEECKRHLKAKNQEGQEGRELAFGEMQYNIYTHLLCMSQFEAALRCLKKKKMAETQIESLQQQMLRVRRLVQKIGSVWSSCLAPLSGRSGSWNARCDSLDRFSSISRSDGSESDTSVGVSR